MSNEFKIYLVCSDDLKHQLAIQRRVNLAEVSLKLEVLAFNRSIRCLQHQRADYDSWKLVLAIITLSLRRQGATEKNETFWIVEISIYDSEFKKKGGPTNVRITDFIAKARFFFWKKKKQNILHEQLIELHNKSGII